MSGAIFLNHFKNRLENIFFLISYHIKRYFINCIFLDKPIGNGRGSAEIFGGGKPIVRWGPPHDSLCESKLWGTPRLLSKKAWGGKVTGPALVCWAAGLPTKEKTMSRQSGEIQTDHNRVS